jgi:hypothetical protein
MISSRTKLHFSAVFVAFSFFRYRIRSMLLEQKRLVCVFVHAALKWLLPLLHHLFLCEGTSTVSIRRKSGAAAAPTVEEGKPNRLKRHDQLFFSRICKIFAYHCIKYKRLNKHTTGFYQTPKEVDLTQPMLDHLSNRPHASILHKRKRPIPTQRYDLGGGLASSWLPGRALSNGREERVQCFGVGRSQVTVDELSKVSSSDADGADKPLV